MGQEDGQSLIPESYKDNAAVRAPLVERLGIGLVNGKFPVSYYDGRQEQVGKVISINGFFMGEKIPGFSANNFVPCVEIPASLQKLPDQLWIVDNYRPPDSGLYRTEVVPGRHGFFGRRKVTRQVPVILNRAGKHGENDWSQYTLSWQEGPYYDTGDFHRSGRSRFTFVVPPELAADIDRDTAEDARYPDGLFQAVNPGLVGPDIETQYRRLPASGLVILNRRVNAFAKPADLVKFQKPIPF